jgi:hypothetical protein
MDAIGLALAIVGGVLSFLTCRPDFSPEGVAGAAVCSVIQAAVAPSDAELPTVDETAPQETPEAAACEGSYGSNLGHVLQPAIGGLDRDEKPSSGGGVFRPHVVSVPKDAEEMRKSSIS